MSLGGADVESSGRREFLLSKGWIQAVVLVVLVGFTVLGLLAYRTYQAKPRLPARVVDPAGRVLYTGAQISHGQKVFLNHGLMEYGSAFGHGAHLGPDFTADYLRRSSEFVRAAYGGAQSDRGGVADDPRLPHQSLRQAHRRAAPDRPQVDAHRPLVADYFSDPKTEHGLKPDAITDRGDLADLTAFFGWTAWAAAATRPGHNYSYQQLAL